MDRVYNRSYFFDSGLRFECQQCGACCTGEPGIVYIDDGEVKQVAQYLSVQVSEFIRTYLDPCKNGYSIRELADGRCYFYNGGCTIYAVRPNQCKTFPFWFENLRSQKKWMRVAKACPGIGRGSLYSKEQVLKIVGSTIDEVVKRHLADD